MSRKIILQTLLQTVFMIAVIIERCQVKDDNALLTEKFLNM